MNHDVFISFSFQDQEVAELIVNRLTNQYNIPCWICTRDINGGNLFKEQIEQAIVKASVVVFIQSSNAISSREIPKELGIALEEEKTIIPFKIDRSKLAGQLRYDLAGIEFIDATKPTIEDRIAELAMSIHKFILNKSAADPQTLTYELTSSAISASTIFVGREDTLDQIHSAFENEQVIYLYGMGGIGKTEIAKHYAQKHKKDYGKVVFLTYTANMARLLADDAVFPISGMQKRIGIDDKPQKDEDYADEKIQVLRSIADKNTLIIIDGFDASNDPYLDKLINGINCKFLITTRNEPERGKNMIIRIKELDDETLKDLVISFSNPERTLIEKSDPAFADLFHLVQNHTHTLELIAKYMGENCIDDVQEMVDMLTNHSLSVLSNGAKNDRFAAIRYLFQLTSLSEEEQFFLRCLAMFPLSGAANKMLRKWVGDTYSARAHLVELGMVILHPYTKLISLHPVIKEIVISDLKPTWSNCKMFIEKFASDLIDHIAWNYSSAEKNMYFDYLRSIKKYVGCVDHTNYESYFRMINFSSFVGGFEDVIRDLEQLKDVSCRIFGEKSANVGKVMHRLGWCYFAHGDIAHARTILEDQAYPILKEYKYDVPGEYIHCCCDLAKIYFSFYQADSTIAQNIVKIEQFIFESKNIVEDPIVLKEHTVVQYRRIMFETTVSSFYIQAKKYAEAIKHAEYAAELAHSLPNMVLDEAAILAQKVLLYKRIGEYSHAIKTAEKALDIMYSHSSMLTEITVHAKRTLTLLSDVSECYYQLGDLVSALSFAHKAVETAEKIYIHGHPTITELSKRHQYIQQQIEHP